MYKYEIDLGVEAGLKMWLGFIIGFTILGVSPVISICLGAAAGLSAGLLVSYWKAAKLPDDVAPPTQEQESIFRRVGRFTTRLGRPPKLGDNISSILGRKPKRRIGGK